MHTDTIELIDFLARNRATLIDAVSAVRASRHSEKPAPGRWSVAQVLEHLGIVETRITTRLSAAIAAAHPGARTNGERPPFTIDEAMVERLLDRANRFMTSAASEPVGGLDVKAAMDVLRASRERLLEIVAASDDLPLDGPVGPHPLLGPIDFRQWIVFAGAHDGRHAAQIREIAEALGS